MKEMVGGCCVCSDERGWPDNPLVYCDGNGCTVAVHQACYGIVNVPIGPWYCRKCESPETKGKVKCELCPSKSGALKRTDNGGWAHVVCALYIPEVRFGNVTSMEPIVLRLIPPERYNKQCYICQDGHKSHRASAGACMQCNKSGCKQQFHVTCAQSLGLLCEEAGNYLDNVKYCGYCQHHYSKLKKGGNVKTIPPYKPVSLDSQSSDSSASGEKEAELSPMASGGSGTPTQATKSKGPGRKSSQSSNSVSGKNTPSQSKTPTNTNQLSDKKKPSPARRGSSTGEPGPGSGTGSGSKASTPAHSPQDAPDAPLKGGSTPGGTKVAPPASSPSTKTTETSVISTATGASSSGSSSTGTTSTAVTTSVVQAPPKPYQETVITNAESMETKQTKKRKAVSVSNAANAPSTEYNATTPTSGAIDNNPQSGNSAWEAENTDVQMDGVEKVIKKAKTEGAEGTAPCHFSSVSPAPPPPPLPPAYSPSSQPSPRHLPSPMPGPSGMHPAPNIRSPQQVSTASEMSAPSPHIFHQPQKQAAMEPSAHGPAAHAHAHAVPARAAWAGLNVSYEMQQDPSKPNNVSGMGGQSKDGNPGAVGAAPPPAPPAAVRNKKRAAMTTSVVSMAPTPPSTIQAPGLAGVRRQPQPQPPPPPPPVYQETLKDSPPSSPSSDRPLKPKTESMVGASCTAPHMLGNELNPESGAAARLQEQLSAELAAHAAGGGAGDSLVPPPLINKAQPSGANRGGSSAQSLDQLLERQWEQGSQFLMEQAQHFDIASLLSCLHQLRTENVVLEERVGSLLQRRDHLLAVNARLAIPLNTAVSGPPETSRCARENGSQVRAPPAPAPLRAAETITSDRTHQLIMRDVQQKPS